jgi:hypothetical protein
LLHPSKYDYVDFFYFHGTADKKEILAAEQIGFVIKLMAE